MSFCPIQSVINLFDPQNTSSHSISEIAEIIAMEADQSMLHLIWDPYIEALMRRVPAATSEGIEPALDPKARSQESMVLLLHGTPVTDVAARVAFAIELISSSFLSRQPDSGMLAQEFPATVQYETRNKVCWIYEKNVLKAYMCCAISRSGCCTQRSCDQTSL